MLCGRDVLLAGESDRRLCGLCAGEFTFCSPDLGRRGARVRPDQVEGGLFVGDVVGRGLVGGSGFGLGGVQGGGCLIQGVLCGRDVLLAGQSGRRLCGLCAGEVTFRSVDLGRAHNLDGADVVEGELFRCDLSSREGIRSISLTLSKSHCGFRVAAADRCGVRCLRSDQVCLGCGDPVLGTQDVELGCAEILLENPDHRHLGVGRFDRCESGAGVPRGDSSLCLGVVGSVDRSRVEPQSDERLFELLNVVAANARAKVPKGRSTARQQEDGSP